MAAVGCQLHADLTELAVMWFGRALANLHKFWDLAGRADRYFRHHRPDAVVLIDYPGFNWWIAWRAKIHGIPVFYYTPPQIWAWATWRAKKMRRLSDHVLCSLPFEEDVVPPTRLQCDVCRPSVLRRSAAAQARRIVPRIPSPPRGPLVTILPGSRTQEVLHNLPWFLKAAARVRQAVPEARFAVAAFKPKHAEMARQMMAGEQGAGSRSGERGEQVPGSQLRSPTPNPAIEIYSGRTPELMHLATCCMACSGSVSMELLYYTKPTVIHYWISPLAYAVQKRFRKVKYITLVNLLSTGELYPADLSPYDPSQPGAEKVLFPEYLTCEDKSAAVAGHVIQWLKDPAALARQIAALEQLKAEVAHGGASARAAEYILRELR